MSSVFFLFKQKTAYEMRISDWSSDVCSSDRASIYTNLVIGSNTLPYVSRLAIHRNTPGNDQLFHFTAGTHAGIGQNLLRLGVPCIPIQILSPSLRDLRRIFQLGQRLLRLFLGFMFLF